MSAIQLHWAREDQAMSSQMVLRFGGRAGELFEVYNTLLGSVVGVSGPLLVTIDAPHCRWSRGMTSYDPRPSLSKPC